MKLLKLLALVAVLALGVGASIAYANDSYEGGSTTTEASSVDDNAFWCWIASRNPTWTPPANVDCQETTTTTNPHPCTAAHPCPPEVCEEVGAHGDDCLPPETTTTTRTTPPNTCANGAGKDGQPGNDDCAVTSTTTHTETTPPATSTTTTTETTSTSGTTTTTPTTTDESGSSSTTTTTESPVVPASPSRPANEQIAQQGTLPNTGFSTGIAAALGVLMIGSGLALRRKFSIDQ